jgi:CO/xanthine dehydrogenase Mo-binding subunit
MSASETTALRRQSEMRDRSEGFAILGAQAHLDGDLVLALAQLAGLFALHRRAQRERHLRDGEALIGRALAIDVHLELGAAGGVFHLHVADAGRARGSLPDLAGEGDELLVAVAAAWIMIGACVPAPSTKGDR